MSQDGVKLLADANQKLASKSWFGGNKMDEAADLFARAGNAFKLQKKWKQSGDAFMLQGQTLEKMGERDESATCYLNASKSYKKEHPKDAVSALTWAIEILIEKGRFSAAAGNQKQIAEIQETELCDFAAAMEAYEKAAEWYQAEDSAAQAAACSLKVAQYAATMLQYDRAITVFEQVAEKSLGNNLTKWSVREYLLKAGICLLCTGDTVRCSTSFDRYKNMDASFSSTRESGLLSGLLEAIENEDVEAFTGHLQSFDKMTKLDDWKTSLLLRVKKSMETEEADYT